MYLRRALGLLVCFSAVALSATALSGCADSRLDAASAQAVAAVPRIYRLGVGDKIKLGVYGEQDLSGQFEVNALGIVPVPLIGDVPAQGHSLQEFRDHVQRRLANGYVKAPKVSVEIISYWPIYVHGEVRNSGEFAFKNGMRLRDLIAMAGG